MPATGVRTKKKTVTMVIPEGVFGGRGKTEFKKTPSRVTHTGINLKKRGKQSSITIQRKCAWYNAQLEAEKRGINLEDPPEEWQKFFDTIKKQLEKPNDGEGLVHEDGRLIWSIPSVPGGCVEDKENLAKQNVAEKVRFQKIESRKQQNTAAEMRLLSNLTPVQSRWVKRRGSGVTRGLLAVLNARQNTDNKQEPSSKPAIAAGPPPIVVNSPPPFPRGRAVQEHIGTRDTTPCFPRTKAPTLKHCSTGPRTLFNEMCYASGRKKIKRRRSMSARALKILLMSTGEEVTKKSEVRNPFLKLRRREFCNTLKITNSPSTSSKPDLVPSRKDIAICEEGKQKLTDVCEGVGTISRNLSPTALEGLTTSPGQLDSEVILRSAERPTPLLLTTCSDSRKLEMLEEGKRHPSPANIKVSHTPNVESKHERVCLALPDDGDVKKITNFSSAQSAEQRLANSQQFLDTQPLRNKVNESKLLEIPANSYLVTTPLQSPVFSCRSTPLLEGPTVGARTEKSEKRKKLNQHKQVMRKKRRLESDSQNIILTDGLRSTKSSEIAPSTSPSDKLGSTLTNSEVLSLQTPATPEILKPIEKKLSPGFVISKSEKPKNRNNAQILRSSKRIRFRKLLASKKNEPCTFSIEETLVTPQRLVVQEKQELTSSKPMPGGGEDLKPVLGMINPDTEVIEVKAKLMKRKKRKLPQRKIRTRKTLWQRIGSKTPQKKKLLKRQSKKLKQRNGRHKTPQTKKILKDQSPGSQKNNIAVVRPVKMPFESEECVFPLSCDRLEKQFKLLERNVDQMTALHKKRFTAVFSKMEKLETMVEVLGQRTRDALERRLEYLVSYMES